MIFIVSNYIFVAQFMSTVGQPIAITLLCVAVFLQLFMICLIQCLVYLPRVCQTVAFRVIVSSYLMCSHYFVLTNNLHCPNRVIWFVRVNIFEVCMRSRVIKMFIKFGVVVCYYYSIQILLLLSCCILK